MPVVYIDTNAPITGFEGPEVAAEPILHLLRAFSRANHKVVTSELTIAELVAPPARQNAFSVEGRVLREGSDAEWPFSVLPVRRGILVATALLRRDYPLKLADSIHVATALSAGCSLFLSNDGGLAKLPLTLKRVPTDMAGIGTILSVPEASR